MSPKKWPTASPATASINMTCLVRVLEVARVSLCGLVRACPVGSALPCVCTHPLKVARVFLCGLVRACLVESSLCGLVRACLVESAFIVTLCVHSPAHGGAGVLVRPLARVSLCGLVCVCLVGGRMSCREVHG